MTPKDVTAFHKRYYLLAKNRMDFVMRTKKENYSAKKASLKEEEPQFRPKVDKKSEKILKDKQLPKGASYADYLFAKGKEYQQRREDRLKDKQDAEQADENLTFTPQILRKESNKDEEPKPSKWEELYQHKEKYFKGKFDRERDAMEFTDAPEEFTFEPKILGDKRVGKPQATFAETKAAAKRGEAPVPT